MKKCSKCGTLKELTEFHKDKTHKDGLSSVCKECRNKISTEWRISNHEKFVTYHRDRFKDGQEYLATLKTPCAKCGEDRLYLIQFHHVNPTEKDFVLGSSGVFKSKSRIKREADKCICLCANCHIEYHRFYGKQPDNPVETLTEYLGRK